MQAQASLRKKSYIYKDPILWKTVIFSNNKQIFTLMKNKWFVIQKKKHNKGILFHMIHLKSYPRTVFVLLFLLFVIFLNVLSFYKGKNG